MAGIFKIAGVLRQVAGSQSNNISKRSLSTSKCLDSTFSLIFIHQILEKITKIQARFNIQFLVIFHRFLVHVKDQVFKI